MNRNASAHNPVDAVDYAGNFFAILNQHKGLALAVFGIFAGLAFLLHALLPQTFKAGAALLLERESTGERALLFRMNPPPNYEQYDWMNAEIEIIGSYPVCLRVADSLRLQEGTLLENPTTLPQAAQALQRALRVEKIRNSNVIEITYTSRDPQRAVRVLEETIQAYLRYRAEVFSESSAYDFFEEQMQIANAKLRQLEQDQIAFQEREKIASVGDQKAILLARLEEYEKSLTRTRTGRMNKESQLAVIKEQFKSGQPDNLPAIDAIVSPVRQNYLAQLRVDLLNLELQRTQLAQKFKPDQRALLELDQRISVTRAKFAAELRQIVATEEAALRALMDEERKLQGLVEQTHRDMQALAKTEYEFHQLSRGLDDTQEVYSMLLKQREEARLAMAKAQNGIKIRTISPAMASTSPSPQKKLLVAGLLIAGSFAGITSTLLRNTARASVSPAASSRA